MPERHELEKSMALFFVNSILTSQPRGTLTSVPAGCVDALADCARGRQTFVHILVAEVTERALRAHAQVLPAASREIDVRHTRASVLTPTRHHISLKKSDAAEAYPDFIAMCIIFNIPGDHYMKLLLLTD